MTGGLAYNKGEHNAAIEYYDKIVALDKSYAAAYYNRGLAKVHLLDYIGAVEDFGKAVEIDPNFAAEYYIAA